MAIRLGDTAPDFTAETTEGTINFHEYLGTAGESVLHPKDFTRYAPPSWAPSRSQGGVRQA